MRVMVLAHCAYTPNASFALGPISLSVTRPTITIIHQLHSHAGIGARVLGIYAPCISITQCLSLSLSLSRPRLARPCALLGCVSLNTSIDACHQRAGRGRFRCRAFDEAGSTLGLTSGGEARAVYAFA